MKITLKNRTFLRCMAVIAGMVVVLVMAACASGPRVPAEGYRQIKADGFHVTNFGIAPFYSDPSFGVTKDEDNNDVYYMENAKNAIIEAPHRGSIDPVFPAGHINVRGYTRVTVDIRADNAELLEDMDVFRSRFIGEASWSDWDGTREWRVFKEKLISGDPTEFQTFEWSIGGAKSSEWGDGNPLLGVENIVLRFLTISDEDIPGRVYFRNFRFYP